VTVGEPEDLLKLAPFETSDYSDYSLVALTAYAVSWLERWGIATTLENIAVASYRLFPAKFAVVGWHQFPDLLRTNRSLMQMRPKHRNMATSVTAEGVFLNIQGKAEAEALLDKLGPPVLSRKGKPVAAVQNPIRVERGKRPRTVHPENIAEKTRSSELFKLFEAGRWEAAQTIHLLEMLNVYDHTPGDEKRRRLRERADAARAVEDKRLVEFLKAVDAKFKGYLARAKAR